jgi:hypothetical protein
MYAPAEQDIYNITLRGHRHPPNCTCTLRPCQYTLSARSSFNCQPVTQSLSTSEAWVSIQAKAACPVYRPPAAAQLAVVCSSAGSSACRPGPRQQCAACPWLWWQPSALPAQHTHNTHSITNCTSGGCCSVAVVHQQGRCPHALPCHCVRSGALIATLHLLLCRAGPVLTAATSKPHPVVGRVQPARYRWQG